MTQKIGLEALFGMDEFRQGIAEYMKSIGGAEKDTDKAAGGMNAALDAVAKGGAAALSAGAAIVASAVGAITAAAIAGTRAVLDWGDTVDSIGDVLGTSSRESAALAVAIQGVGGDARTMASQMAFLTRGLYSANGELGPTGQALSQLGIAFQDANGNMLPSTDILSNVADRVGVLPDGLEKTRIMMALFGKSGKDLSDVLGALANGGMAAADEKARALGLSMSEEATAASIQLGREFANLKMAGQGLLVTFGNAFLPGILKAAEGINTFVTAIVAATQEGGALYPIIQGLSAVMGLLGDIIGNGATAAANALTSFATGTAETLTQTADNAVTWGSNIIVQLANGIIQAAGSVLTGAMNVVGGMLEFFLAPGSPPRVAPEIDAWGMSAMGEYLQGMTNADFGVLKSIQGPLQSILGATMDPGDAASAFSSITRGLADAMGSLKLGGTVDNGLFDQIRAAGGQYGAELSRLARDQLALAAATMQTKKASEELAAAQDRSKAATGKVSALTREYNNLLRAGASPAVLAAKLKEINAAEQARDAAQADIKTKEEALRLSKEDETTAKDKADATAGLVDQVMTLLRAEKAAQKESEKAAKEAGSSGDGAGALKLPTLEGLGGAQESAVSAIDTLKETIKERAAGMLAPITDTWNTMKEQVSTTFESLKAKLQPVFDWFKGVWEGISTVVGSFVNTVKPYIDDVGAAVQRVFQEQSGPLIEAFKELWIEISPILSAALKALGAVLVFLAGIFTGLVTAALKRVAPALETIMKVATSLIKVFTNVIKFVASFVKLMTGLFLGNSEMIESAMSDMGKAITGIIKYLVKAVTDYFYGMFKEILAGVDGFVDGALGFFTDLYKKTVGNGTALIPKLVKDIIGEISKLPGEALTQIGNFITNITTTITNAFPIILQAGKDIIGKIKEGITTTWNTVTEAFGTLLSGWNLGSYASGVLSKLVTLGSDMIGKIKEGLSNSWSTITGKISELLGKLGIGDLWDSAKNALASFGGGILGKIADGLSSAWSTFTSKMSEVFKKLQMGDISGAWQTILDFGSSVMGKIAEGLKTAWSKITTGLAETFGKFNILDLGATAIGKIWDVGSAIIERIWYGMRSAWQSWVLDNISGSLLSSLPDWFKNMLGIGGMSGASASQAPSAAMAASLAPAATASLTPAAVGSTSITNITFNQSVSSTMDLAMVTAAVRQVLALELTI